MIRQFYKRENKGLKYAIYYRAIINARRNSVQCRTICRSKSKRNASFTLNQSWLRMRVLLLVFLHKFWLHTPVTQDHNQATFQILNWYFLLFLLEPIKQSCLRGTFSFEIGKRCNHIYLHSDGLLWHWFDLKLPYLAPLL